MTAQAGRRFHLVSATDAEWMLHAACAGMDADLWFPDTGDSRGCAAAKAVCAACPVRGDCLDYALTHAIKHGIWGGTSERERRPLRKARGMLS